MIIEIELFPCTCVPGLCSIFVKCLKAQNLREYLGNKGSIGELIYPSSSRDLGHLNLRPYLLYLVRPALASCDLSCSVLTVVYKAHNNQAPDYIECER